MKKLYLISFLNHNTNPFTEAILHDFIKQQIDWFHYTDGTYLITSKETLHVLNKLIHAVLGENATFFILQLSRKVSYSGYLPRDAWKWIKKYL